MGWRAAAGLWVSVRTCLCVRGELERQRRCRVDPLGVAGFVNSLYVFDPDQFVWTDLSSNVTGTPPSPRRFAGVTSIGRKVYVYGGFWEGELGRAMVPGM